MVEGGGWAAQLMWNCWREQKRWWRGRRLEATGHSGSAPGGGGGGAEESLEAPVEGGRGGCQGGMTMTVTKSNEVGGAYRLADEGGQQGGYPPWTSSEGGKREFLILYRFQIKSLLEYIQFQRKLFLLDGCYWTITLLQLLGSVVEES